MSRVWTRREVPGSSAHVWNLLTDLERWPEWGPTVQSATLADGRFEQGATGTVTTIGGLSLPFEVVDYEEGSSWSWNVAGVPATDHRVEPLGPDRCRVGFGVPALAMPYLSICRVALARIARLVKESPS